MTVDLKELERLARAATPGPWVFAKDTGSWGASFDDYGTSSYCGVVSDEGTVMALTVAHSKSLRDDPDPRPDAAYIAYANPAAILSLIQKLEQAKKDAGRLDWLDSKNLPKKIGWSVGAAPVGNVSVTSVIFLGKEPVSIREAIDAAIAKEQT